MRFPHGAAFGFDLDRYVSDAKVGGDAAVYFAQEVLADPVEAQAKAARGQALIDREYSPARFAEKVGRAYAAVAAAR